MTTTTGLRLCAAAQASPHPNAPAPDCRPMRGVHLDGCDGEPCRGCEPRLAAPGLAVCWRCRNAVLGGLRDIGLLHKHLLTPTKAGPGGARPEGSEAPAVLGDDAIEARTASAEPLTAWTHSLDEQIAPHVWDLHEPGRWAIRPPLASATWFPGQTRPGPTVLAMAARLIRHTDRLLADDQHAVGLVHNITTIEREARRRAYPVRPVGRVIGDCPVGRADHSTCGGTVRAVVDSSTQTGWAECATCKTGGVIEWWQAQMPAEKWLTLKALRFHLLLHVGKAIPDKTIFGWASSTDDSAAQLPTSEDPSGTRLYLVERARELAAEHRRPGMTAERWAKRRENAQARAAQPA